MIIGLLTVRLHIPESHSLKSKRRITKSLKERLRSRFNISVAEIGDYDKWQLATIAVATLSNDKAHADSSLSSVLNFIEGFRDIDIVDRQTELL